MIYSILEWRRGLTTMSIVIVFQLLMRLKNLLLLILGKGFGISSYPLRPLRVPLFLDIGNKSHETLSDDLLF